MNSKRKIIIIMLVALLLTACQKTPSTTIINNDTIDIKPMETETSVDIDNLPVITLREETIDEVWECGDVTVTVKGTKTIPDSLEGLHMYEAEVNDHYEFEENMLFLFDEHLDSMEVSTRGNYYVICQECDYTASIVNSCREVDGSPNDICFYKSMRPVTEDMQKVNMTEKDAITKTKEIIDKIGAEEYELEKIFYCEERLQITPEGTLASPTGDTLTVFYRKKLQGIPVMSTLLYYKIDPMVNIEFDSKGIRRVQIADYVYSPYGEIEESISYEEAVEAFKKYIGRYEEFDGAVFDKISFEYTIAQEYVDGKLIEIAVPCWHFYCVRDYWDSFGFLTSKDIVVNCFDGSVTEKR